MQVNIGMEKLKKRPGRQQTEREASRPLGWHAVIIAKVVRHVVLDVQIGQQIGNSYRRQQHLAGAVNWRNLSRNPLGLKCLFHHVMMVSIVKKPKCNCLDMCDWMQARDTS